MVSVPYRLDSTAGVILVESGEHIAPDRSDPRWRAYREWVKGGNVPAPAPATVEPIEQLRARIVSQINQQRHTRHDLPILYAGTLFDADTDARENITGTIARILRGDGIPPGWLGWRASDNSMLWCDATEADVLVQLRGLASAIEDRKQALLIAAWIKKARVAEMDREALDAYDIDAGWPG